MIWVRAWGFGSGSLQLSLEHPHVPLSWVKLRGWVLGLRVKDLVHVQ